MASYEMSDVKDSKSDKDTDFVESDNRATIILTLITFVTVIIKFVLSGINNVPNNPFFINSTGNVSDKYQIDITPASYTFIIWGIIYFWEAAWMLYAVISIWRKFYGEPVLMSPDILTKKFYISYIMTSVAYITWLFVWDREYLLIAFIVLLLITAFGYAAVAFQSIATVNYGHVLKDRSPIDLTLVYILVQNGTDLFFSWTTVATLINLATALVYDPMVANNMTNEAACTLSLSLLAVLVIGWSVAENTIFYDYFHFVYAWYGVLIWACTGILVKNFEAGNQNTILTIALLCVSVVCLAIKILVFALKYKNRRGCEVSSQF